MPTRNISLTPEQDAFIQGGVRSGEYQNASEAVRDALRCPSSGDARTRSSSRHCDIISTPAWTRSIGANLPRSTMPGSTRISMG